MSMFLRACQIKGMRFIAPLVWLAIAQVLMLTLMASSPELHEYFHNGSEESQHHCLASDFQAGSIDHPIVVPVVTPECLPLPVGEIVFAAESRQSLAVHLCGSLLVHGPPEFA